MYYVIHSLINRKLFEHGITVKYVDSVCINSYTMPYTRNTLNTQQY